MDQLKADIDRLIEDKSTPLQHDEILGEIENRLNSDIESFLNAPDDACPAHSVSAVVEPTPTPTPEVVEPVIETNELTASSPEPEPVLPADSVENPEESKPEETTQKVQKTAPVEVLRIQKPKIDFLLEAFGEQVILQSTLEQCKFDLEGNKNLLMKTISQLTKLTYELQTHALSLTMIQLGPTFTKLERAIRDAARICEKKIEIEILGADTEVDKSLITQLSDPLTHMVRNAVDHAVESPQERIAIGKPEEGHVRIQARRTGGQLWIEVSDDGKGLNPQALREKAINKGLITPEAAVKLSDQESYNLIFHNGFSTKEAVSEVSGRGVGMNVVRETIESLKGTIEIDSEVGKGTTFRMKLPLSLAIFNGAIVRVNENKFVIPNSEISEVGKLDLTQCIPIGKDKHSVQVRDEVFQLVDLRKCLVLPGGPSKEPPVSNKTVLPALFSRKMKNVAYVVDEILGMQKIVQKPLGEEVKSHTQFAAGTILSDGSPGVILNLDSLKMVS
ncbi:MAG TPA: hypothetical protein DCL41_04725 [Bdellovibrionales bacterium]|nr:hypothetical protein [Pseudobdellovibrionaceae bacterium]HAG91149.1 hypothetical protein [Bdellovibrionales bacterium]